MLKTGVFLSYCLIRFVIQGDDLKHLIILLALGALTGCAANRPICVAEDPAYLSHMQSCMNGKSELRMLLVQGSDLSACNAQANAKGLYTRNPQVCNDPVLHADIIRQKR